MSKKIYKNARGFDLYSEYADLTFPERMLLSPWVKEAYKDSIRKGIIIDVNEVRNYQDSFIGRGIDYSDFPTIAPPYDEMVFLSSMHQDCFEVNYGVLVTSHIMPSTIDLNEVSKMLHFSDEQLTNTKWVFVCTHFCEVIDTEKEEIGYAAPIHLSDVLVSSEGVCLGIQNSLPKLQLSKELQLNSIHQGINHTCTALFALSFMHCKNIVLTQTEKKDRGFFERETKQVDKLDIRHHTIDIHPIKTILKKEGNSEVTGLKKALHICRGHFSTYTEERKLFGKVAGTFWIPQHTRGSLEYGEVTKDYKITDRSKSDR